MSVYRPPATAQCKVYFYGTGDGKMIKIGKTRDPLRVRRQSLEQGQLVKPNYRLLAAVHGGRTQETALHERFAALHVSDSGSKEIFYAEPELVRYVNWLRQQWFTWAEEDDGPDDQPDFAQWRPGPGREVDWQQSDPDVLIQLYEAEPGSLFGTPWAALSRPPPKHNDYYTPPGIVALAREAMGGIDLDAASHWVANREHRIPVYYHVFRSAFDNPWFGRVWLNPPYGDNKPWIEQIIRYWDAREVEQLCMLSPVWAFSAQQARPLMDRSSAMLLLSPTPSFWGRNRKGQDSTATDPQWGSNMPHAIVYLGHRAAEFRTAFASRGVFMSLESG